MRNNHATRHQVDWLEEVWEKISQVVAENKGNIAKIFDDFDVGGDGEVRRRGRG